MKRYKVFVTLQSSEFETTAENSDDAKANIKRHFELGDIGRKLGFEVEEVEDEEI